ncbi:hypothetical protein Dimus_005029 [Dionaea muscipula]
MESKDVEESKGLKAHKTNSLISNPQERLKSSSASSTSSSQSSDFAFEDPMPPDKFESGPDTEEPHQGSKFPAAADSVNSPDLCPKDGSTLQSPPVQVMERPFHDSAYRIPSYVFARNKSGMEWSVASNESLFSINTGNTSFTREQYGWLLKSGELNYAEFGKPGDLPKSGGLLLPSPSVYSTKSGEEEEEEVASNSPHVEQQVTPVLTPVSPTVEMETPTPVKESPVKKPDEADTASVSPASDLGGANSPAAGTKKEDQLKVNMKADQSVAKPLLSEDVLPLSARRSDASGKSFAFPVLTAEADRGSSVKLGGPDCTEQQEKNGKEEATHEATTATPEATQASWLSCFSCCSVRS